MNETGTKENQTPYSAWLQTEILHTLQQTVSNHPDEYAFLINAQVQELYWALIVREMQAAQACSPLRPSLSDSEPTRHHRFHSDSPIGRGRILRPPRPPARHRGNRFEVSQTRFGFRSRRLRSNARFLGAVANPSRMYGP